MVHLSDSLIASVVGSLPPLFESHDVIQTLMTLHPHEYVRELHANLSASDPIRITDALIGRALHRVPGIVPVRRVLGLNPRGRRTANQQWQKRLATAQVPPAEEAVG